MKVVTRDDPKYAMDWRHPPVASVSVGEPFAVETHDCRTGTITRADQVEELRDTRFVNPATGPIAVEGVEPGDTIRIDIESLRVDSTIGLMMTRPGTTALEVTDEPQLRIASCDGQSADIGAFRVPVSPMVGVIGVAPAGDPVPTFRGGEHGGNMDTRLIGPGSRVFLRSLVPGAMVYFGDVHAAMGDGEVFLTGVEIAGRLEVRISKVAGFAVPTPCVQTDDVVAVIASGTTLEEAARSALNKGLEALTSAGLDAIDAGYFMSAAGHLRISQFLPKTELVHCRFELPLDVLRLNEIQLPGIIDA